MPIASKAKSAVRHRPAKEGKSYGGGCFALRCHMLLYTLLTAVFGKVPGERAKVLEEVFMALQEKFAGSESKIEVEFAEALG